jgi:Domain of unknown function (DUF4184)
MPATIPTHPIAVLPLKLLRPRHFDGVALAVGATAPDFAYATAGLGVELPSHAWHALFWFNVPATLLVAALIRRRAAEVAAHLPTGGPFALRDYGVLAQVRHPIGVTVSSALLGALSHLLWDSVTHPYILVVHPFLGGQTYLPALHTTAWAGLPWWRVIQLVSDVLGTVGAVATAVHIGRRRLLVAWHGPAPTVRRRPALFWSVLVAAGAALTAATLAMPGNSIGPNVIGVRLLGAATVAVVVAGATIAAINRVAAPARLGVVRPADREVDRPWQ